MYLITRVFIIAVALCYVSPSLGARRECTVDGEKVASGETWKSDDGCRSCKCKRGKCKIRTSKKAKCQTTTTTTATTEIGPTTSEVGFENKFPEHNEADETETSDKAPKPPSGRSGFIFKVDPNVVCSEHSGYEVTTLTSDDRYSNTNDEFQIRIYAGDEWTDYEILNNPGYDRKRKHWDRYGPLMSLNDDPVDYVQVMHVSGTDGWKIFSIFVRHLCTNKIYEFNCGGCWIDRPGIPYRYIKRTN